MPGSNVNVNPNACQCMAALLSVVASLAGLENVTSVEGGRLGSQRHGVVTKKPE